MCLLQVQGAAARTLDGDAFRKKNRKMVDPSVPLPACARALKQPTYIDAKIPQNQFEEISNACSQNIVNSFKAIQLDIGEFYKVKVSHVEDGPAKFSVQLVENLSALDSMMSSINSNWTSKPMQQVLLPKVGTMYLAKQTRSKKKFCRVILNSLSPSDASCKVYYPDYGNHETLSVDNIYQIPDIYVPVPIFSIEFTLSGITNWKISQKMKKFFRSFILDKILLIRVCKGPISPFIQYCDIYLKNNIDQINIKERLVEVFPDAWESRYKWATKETFFMTYRKACELTYKKKEVLIGSREEVHVTYVDSCSKFFVLCERDFELLHNLSIQIEKISKTASMISASQLYESMPCIALYDLDNKWHRVSVTDIVDQNKVKVFYVDYGNEEVTTIDNLRTIPPEIVSTVPKQALKCRLDLTWDSASENINASFKNKVANKRVSIKFLKTYPQITVVQLNDDKNSLSVTSKDTANFLSV